MMSSLIQSFILLSSLFLATTILIPEKVFAQEKQQNSENANEDNAFIKEAASTRLEFLKSGKGGKKTEQSAWYYAEPIKSDKFKNVLYPEKIAFSPDAKDEKGNPLWKLKPEWKDGVVIQLPSRDRSAYYMTKVITSSTAKVLELGLGSDDCLAVFLNGKKVHENESWRGVNPGQDKVKLKLVAGKNIVMLKVYNGNGATGFSYSSKENLPSAGVWDKLAKKYTTQGSLLSLDDFGPSWIMDDRPKELEIARIKRDLPGELSKRYVDALEKAYQEKKGDDVKLKIVLAAAKFGQSLNFVKKQISIIDPVALEKLFNETLRMNSKAFKDPDAIRAQIKSYVGKVDELNKQVQKNEEKAIDKASEICELQRTIVNAHPALKQFDEVLLIKRTPNNMGLSQNWQGNTSIGKGGYDNEMGRLNIKNKNYKTIYRPKDNTYVGDLDLHFDAQRVLFSGIGSHGRWQVFEINMDGSDFRQVTSGEYNDIDNYEPMYLPSEDIIFTSSSTFYGVPCVAGGDYVGNIHRMKPDGTGVRRLCFDQDNNWCPTLLKDGRILYLRWEYTDSGHYFSRILMHMNPDGTGQNEFYGSNSYWPNGTWYARPLPNSTTKFVAVVSGHHGVKKMGELYLFDISKGRQETEGVVQQIKPHNATPSKMGCIEDGLVNGAWPKFLYPFPLSDKLFLVSAQLQDKTPWGLYIVDTYGNMTLLVEDSKYMLFEPTPIMKTIRPPVIPDKVDLSKTTATAFIQDVYEGTGLRGVPRGTVKSLRVFQYEYSYRNMGGHYAIGMEAGWDVRRIVGDVPVHEDGSAYFVIPANIPLAIQPLDAEGKAMQQMRSWLTAMPGERLQCVGCHERQNQTVLPKRSKALESAPVVPTPFYGPKRGFSFLRDIQPVLNRYCVSCHNGQNNKIPNFADLERVGADMPWQMSGYPKSYWALHPYVRRNGPEGDYHILVPLEFHADTSELVRLLEKGHHGVQMDKGSWDRIITWIDLNVPCHGTWTEVKTVPNNFAKRRQEMMNKYANVADDIEKIVYGDPYDQTPVKPVKVVRAPQPALTAQNFPLSKSDAQKLQQSLGQTTMDVDLGNGKKLTFVRIPAGDFNMGSATGANDEYPRTTVKIEKPFWMCTTEVPIGVYKLFNPEHDNGFYDQHYKDQTGPGYYVGDIVNRALRQDVGSPELPVIRVSWNQSMGFCNWLSKKIGKKVTLPTEAQWEYACRAGTDSDFWYGSKDDDFGKYANLADVSLKNYAVQGIDPRPMNNPDWRWDFVPKINSVNDGVFLLAKVGGVGRDLEYRGVKVKDYNYQKNPWGLINMHGNVAEWTLDNYRPYPYKAHASDATATGFNVKKVVRGGSFRDRPYRATSSYRLDFPAWQRIYNVGFRPIIVEE